MIGEGKNHLANAFKVKVALHDGGGKTFDLEMVQRSWRQILVTRNNKCKTLKNKMA